MDNLVDVQLHLGYRYCHDEQVEELIRIIQQSGQMSVSKVQGDVISVEESNRKLIEKQCDTYIGVVRSGQVLQARGDIVVVGNVNPNGRVEATGSIYVLVVVVSVVVVVVSDVVVLVGPINSVDVLVVSTGFDVVVVSVVVVVVSVVFVGPINSVVELVVISIGIDVGVGGVVLGLPGYALFKVLVTHINRLFKERYNRFQTDPTNLYDEKSK